MTLYKKVNKKYDKRPRGVSVPLDQKKILEPKKKYRTRSRPIGNFGHRPWSSRGHFSQNAGKNLEKKIISKGNN